MRKDPHLKRQKQIRMSDEVRERFETAQKASGLTGEDFICHLLDAADDDGSNSKVSSLVAAELERLAKQVRDGLK